jgi:DNA adenine methylase
MAATTTKRDTKTTLLRPAFKCHGGKHYLKNFVIGHFPAGYEKFTYVEPYSGAASVLLNKRPGTAEILNDLHPGVAAIFMAIKGDPDGYLKRLSGLTYSSETFSAALQQADTPDMTGVDLAVNEYVLRRMSRGGLKRDFGWSERLRGGKPGDVNAWETALKQVSALSRRLQAVTLSCRPALEVLQEFNRDDALAYLDPPYLHTTRTVKKAYDYEMTEADHRQLCEALVAYKGKALVSGYRSQLYDTTLKGWTRVEMNVANHSSQSKVKAVKTECLWMNY